jgi:xanthine dehydrogenase accessory factor
VFALLNDINRLLKTGESVILATILNHRGSTPRSSGASMLLRESGAIVGTIGGGLMEAQVIERAPQLFATQCTGVVHFDLTADKAASMNMICGGKLEVLMEFVAADQDNRRLFERLYAMEKGCTGGMVVTAIPGTPTTQLPSAKCLVAADGSITGNKDFLHADPHHLNAKFGQLRQPVITTLGQQHVYIEPVACRAKLILFGAGHVAQAVARLAHTVDFRVVVIDDRAEFANRQRFGEAEEIVVPSCFADGVEALAIDRNCYVVIVTRGHLHDRSVLAQVLKTDAGYIGMIGSRRKRDAIYASLSQDGYQSFDLKRVHSPIGLDIAAETPEEIAVSIVAELVAVRAAQAKSNAGGGSE